jgi:hypothetical protein
MAEIIEHLAWPVTFLITLCILLRNVEPIGKAFRNLPAIRKITLRDIEVELAHENYDQLKQDTDKVFRDLISKTDFEIGQFASAAQISAYLANFSRFLFSALPIASRNSLDAEPRVVAYIVDPVFEDQLYQVTHYCRPTTGRFHLSESKAPGRRFSIRYGIIGRAARVQESQIIGDAFIGTEEAKRQLILEWSMLPDQAAEAAKKPSCLALAIKDPKSKTFLGIVYADSNVPLYFCQSADEENFISRIENSDEFLKLCESYSDLARLTSQIEIRFDLVNIRKFS